MTQRLNQLSKQFISSQTRKRIWSQINFDAFFFEPTEEKTLKNKVVVISGASRGIGLAIGIRAAKDGAIVVILSKTVEVNPKLPGTIYTAAREIQAAGGTAFPIKCDVRIEEDVISAIQKIKTKFGVIDVLVNNASVIYLQNTETISMKLFDRMQAINLRGYYLLTKYSIPLLRKAKNPHVLNISPSIRRIFPKEARFNKENRLKNNFAYTFSKLGETFLALGLSEQYREEGIAFNTLWPRTIISTAAVYNRYPKEILNHSLSAEVMADAAHVIVTSNAKKTTGNCFMDNEVLGSVGKKNFKEYFQDKTKEWVDLY